MKFNLDLSSSNFIGDSLHTKDREVREFKLFFDQEKQSYGIALFDNDSVYGEYWIANIQLTKEELDQIIKFGNFIPGTKISGAFLFDNYIIKGKPEDIRKKQVLSQIKKLIFSKVGIKNETL